MLFFLLLKNKFDLIWFDLIDLNIGSELRQELLETVMNDDDNDTSYSNNKWLRKTSGTIVESSITQRCIDRLCLNWYFGGLLVPRMLQNCDSLLRILKWDILSSELLIPKSAELYERGFLIGLLYKDACWSIYMNFICFVRLCCVYIMLVWVLFGSPVKQNKRLV